MHKFTVKSLFWTLCKFKHKNIGSMKNELPEIYISCQFEPFTAKNANRKLCNFGISSCST